MKTNLIMNALDFVGVGVLPSSAIIGFNDNFNPTVFEFVRWSDATLSLEVLKAFRKNGLFVTDLQGNNAVVLNYRDNGCWHVEVCDQNNVPDHSVVFETCLPLHNAFQLAKALEAVFCVLPNTKVFPRVFEEMAEYVNGLLDVSDTDDLSQLG